MFPRLAALLIIALLILGLAGHSLAQVTRSYSNPMNFSNNEPCDQNFQTPRYNWNPMAPTYDQRKKNFNNSWGSDNFSSGVEIQVAPNFKTPWGATPFGPSRPEH